MRNKKYKDTIGLISHLILSKPNAVRRLLARYGITFSPAPTRGQLIAQAVELLSENNPSFNDSFSKLLAVHIKRKGGDMLALQRKGGKPLSYYREDEFFGGFVGGLAKNLISGLFKKKNKSKSSSSASTTGSKAAEIEKMKADMQRKMLQLEMERKRKEREDEQRRREREEDKKKREEEDKEKQKKLISGLLIAGGVVVTLVIGGIVIVSLKPKPIPKAA